MVQVGVGAAIVTEDGEPSVAGLYDEDMVRAVEERRGGFAEEGRLDAFLDYASGIIQFRSYGRDVPGRYSMARTGLPWPWA